MEMSVAETAVRDAVSQIPDAIDERLVTGEKLSDEDCAELLQCGNFIFTRRM